MDIGWYKENKALQAELRREYPAVAKLIAELEQQLADERHDCADLALQVAKLEQQLSRYQGGVEVEGVWKQDGILFYPLPTVQLEFNQKVRVLVYPQADKGAVALEEVE